MGCIFQVAYQTLGKIGHLFQASSEAKHAQDPHQSVTSLQMYEYFRRNATIFVESLWGQCPLEQFFFFF